MKIKTVLAIIAALLFIAGGMKKTDENVKENVPTPTPEVTQAPVRTLKVTAVGDCTFATDVNASRELGFVTYAKNKGYDYFFEKVRHVFEDDDLTIVNFEGTLSDRGERADKTFAFRGEPEYVNILTGSSVEAVNLANNHSADYGSVSLSDTREIMEENSILTCRGEDNVTVSEVNGVQVGLVGINYLNDQMRTELDAAINKAKDMGAELIILSIHWGQEKDTSANADQIEAAHRAIDLGCDLVIGTHPHVLQGVEKYKGRYICYSLGNFSFGGNNAPSDRDSAIFTQTFTLNGTEIEEDDDVEIIPCRISGEGGYNNYQPYIAEGERRERIIERITQYSDELGGIELNFR